MTLKAVRLIKENDIIAVPGAEVRETVAYKIAVQAVPELADKELLPIYMPMTHDKAELELNHEKGAKALEAALDTGTVSYTHLDVYKRQVCSNQRNYSNSKGCAGVTLRGS